MTTPVDDTAEEEEEEEDARILEEDDDDDPCPLMHVYRRPKDEQRLATWTRPSAATVAASESD